MKYLKLNTGSEYLAYNKHTASKNNSPTIIFLSGFMSDMNGTKAQHLQKYCEEKDYNYIRFDYACTGSSSGEKADGCISLWKENAKNILTRLGGEKNILVGSSMGGWIMTLLALEIPEKIHSMIGIAVAPDFTQNLLWDILDDDAQNQILTKGVYHLPTEYCNSPVGDYAHYPVTKLLIEDGRKNLVLTLPKLNINMPVTLIHGINDNDVPYRYSTEFSSRLSSGKVEVILQPGGDHRMANPDNLTLLNQVLEKHIMM